MILSMAFIFALIAAFGFWMVYNAKTGPQASMGATLVLVFTILALGFFFAGVKGAHARDDGRYAQSPLKPWFDSLKSGKGPCCSDADGTALPDVDWEATKDGHYRVRIEEKWWIVPDEAVLTQPNLVGRTMVWPAVPRRWQDARSR